MHFRKSIDIYWKKDFDYIIVLGASIYFKEQMTDDSNGN